MREDITEAAQTIRERIADIGGTIYGCPVGDDYDTELVAAYYLGRSDEMKLHAEQLKRIFGD